MTKIVCLLGSPRADGNSDTLAMRFCDAAREAGADVACFALRDLQFRGHMPEAEPDDLTPVLEAIEGADIVAVASPIYFCNITGLLKQAIDRFFTFFVPDYVTADEPSRLGRNKVFLLLQTQGEGPERYKDLLGQYGPALDKLGFERRELIRACGVRAPGDILEKHDCLKLAEQVAGRLVMGR